MKIIEPYTKILTSISSGGLDELKRIEVVARKCYKSEGKITEDGESAKQIVGALIRRGHEAMLEHSQLSVLWVCDRGISHELVRHRLASWAQESTRYCNYSQEKFGHEITVVRPYFFNNDDKYAVWLTAMSTAEACYFQLLDGGATPQEARSVLPNSLKTEVVMTANYREWRNFFKLRCASDAHPQMCQLTLPLLKEVHNLIPVVFDDIYATIFPPATNLS